MGIDIEQCPPSWMPTSLEQVFELHDDRREPLNSDQRAGIKGEYPYYGANGQVDAINKFNYDGDFLLVAEDGGYFEEPHRGVARCVSGQFWVNNHAHVIKAAPELEPRLYQHYLNSIDWTPHVTGTTRLKLTQTALRQIPVPLPPAGEQRRIVAKLDALQSRTRLAREALAAIPALLDHYRQSVLAAAFRGELTNPGAERGDAASPEGWDHGIEQATWTFDDLPVGWVWLGFDEIMEDCTDSRRKLKTDGYRPSGRYPVIDQGEATIAGWSDDESLVQTAKPPFVLFGDHTRKVQSVTVPFIQGADGLKVYKAKARIRPDYLAWLLRGISLPNKGYSRHAKFITAARYPVPPTETQQKICNAVQRAWTAADGVATTVSNMVSAGKHLDQSLLATAFRGELVPQDPADEPASVLLDRIRAARAQAGDAPRIRRPRTPAAAPSPARAAEPTTPYRATTGDPYATLLAALRAKGSLASSDAQAATGLDAAAVRPLLQRLVAERAAKVEGQKRGTRYVAIH